MQSVEQWNVFEIELQGSTSVNPFTDVTISASFTQGHRVVRVDGFYDGDGIYRIRFSPDTAGNWAYITHANIESLDGVTGEFACTAAEGGNHGPVGVHARTRFVYADGTTYVPVGTTCYAWNHQSDKLMKQTVETLSDAPFNKMRMCVFPKHYPFNKSDPTHFPFAGNAPTEWDFTRFNPMYFLRLEARITELLKLGIEADLILFHPYDKWGFATMTSDGDDRYLRYVVARLSSFRNVWWSFANEYDLMKKKSESDWDRFFRIVQQHDPYQRLRSIHNCRGFYDHGKPWVTHCSVQHHELSKTEEWIETYQKPVVVDECGYEGNIPHDWGNLPAAELVNRFWTGFAMGGFVGHGETYVHEEDLLWWSKGGLLHGESPERIAFLRKIMEEAPDEGYTPLKRNSPPADATALICYHGIRQPMYKFYQLPKNRSYRAEVIDTWDMTVTPADGVFTGEAKIELPGKSGIAVRFILVS